MTKRVAGGGSPETKVDQALTKDRFGALMAELCPSDAAGDAEMKRLLGELDRRCGEKKE